MTIRPAQPADINELCRIEIEAGRLFYAVDMPEVAADVPDLDELAHAQQEDRVWVATDGGTCLGYIVASTVDGNAHIDQVSVRPNASRQGIGRQLIAHIETWGRSRAAGGTTLTTFRDVPWNGPYYRRLGFCELSTSEVGPELEAILEREASLPGLDPALRCAMFKPNGVTPGGATAMVGSPASDS